ncbi:NAD(P)-dependent oxidoreductase [Streptomyces sp. NPDC015125]|uniref:NAD(P)-dependent oxidoreductase n=1 Tax=Streptomyces sp. NPDC015125 TaxID=3364938 RepID=UPI003700B1BC
MSSWGKRFLHYGRAARCAARRAPDRAALLDAVRDAAALIVRSATRVDAEVPTRAPRLRISHTVGVAELTVGLVSACLRGVCSAAQLVRAGERNRSAVTGNEFAGHTPGVLGLGRVGRQVAWRCGVCERTVVTLAPARRMRREVVW